MNKRILKLLTFWIPVKSWRKVARKNLASFLYSISPDYIKTIKILKKQLKETPFIFATISIKWSSALYQRPQHIAIQMAQKKISFLYAEGETSFKKAHQKNNIFFVNYNILFAIPFEIREKIYLIIPNTASIFSYKFTQKLKELGYRLIYEYIDDFDESILGNNTAQLDLFNNLEKINPDLILATAKNLYAEMVARFGKDKVLLNPNAVDISNFLNVNSKDIPQDLVPILNNKKPIIGYYGAMAPWLDWELINKMHKERPDYNFVYIGINYQKALKNLESLPNVFFLGAKDYKDLPKYSIHFDCCTIPFRLGDIAKSTSPLKLFEYMAMKKPTVCTKDLLECYGYDGVLISQDHDDFINNLDKAILISKDKKIQDRLFEAAAANTWEKRAEDIINKIRELNQ